MTAAIPATALLRPPYCLCNALTSVDLTSPEVVAALRRRSIVSSSTASRASRAALTPRTSGKGWPNCLALFCTANFGLFKTTEARAADAPLCTRLRRSSICSVVHLRHMTRVIHILYWLRRALDPRPAQNVSRLMFRNLFVARQNELLFSSMTSCLEPSRLHPVGAGSVARCWRSASRPPRLTI